MTHLLSLKYTVIAPLSMLHSILKISNNYMEVFKQIYGFKDSLKVL